MSFSGKDCCDRKKEASSSGIKSRLSARLFCSKQGKQGKQV